MKNADKSVAPLIGYDYQQTGITLREHFAGLAMQGWLATFVNGEECAPELLAEHCVNIADALLAALEQ